MGYKHDYIIYDPKEDIWIYTGYPGYYVSASGYILGPGSLGRESHILKSYSNDKYGHQMVDIYVNGKRTHKYVHRLVANAFIPNYKRYPEVCHIDGDPNNNSVSNLRWGTHVDNMNDARKHKTFHDFTKEEMSMGVEVLKTPVKAIDIITGEEFVFESQADAARSLNIYQPNIRHVLSGCYKQTGGFRFEYINKEEYYGNN